MMDLIRNPRYLLSPSDVDSHLPATPTQSRVISRVLGFDLKIEYDRAERYTLEVLYSDYDLGPIGPLPADIFGPWWHLVGTSTTTTRKHGRESDTGGIRNAPTVQ